MMTYECLKAVRIIDAEQNHMWSIKPGDKVDSVEPMPGHENHSGETVKLPDDKKVFLCGHTLADGFKSLEN